jgi:hypothetical protein
VKGKEAVLFVNKKNQKNFFNFPAWDLAATLPQPRAARQKFFWFFFFKKRTA